MALLFEPFAPLFELSREVDRRLASGLAAPSFVPATDVVVTHDDVRVVMDVPGLKVEDLTIELQNDVLTVRGERPFPTVPEDEQSEGRVWQRLERGFGKFERVLSVPHGLDADQITASMADGVLTLHIPKPEVRRPRRIEITTGRQAQALDQSAGEQRELAGSTA